MHSSTWALGVVCLVFLVSGCGDPDLDAWSGDTAAQDLAAKSVPTLADLAPDGFTFAANGTHVEPCTGNGKCPTMWAELPAPNTCNNTGPAREAYVLHQRAIDWNGNGGEVELHGQTYQLSQRLTGLGTAPAGTLPVLVNQSVIVQCCNTAAGIVIAMKVCPDPCDSPDGQCPITLASGPNSTVFGQCKTTSGPWQLPVPHCDLQVVEADWMDPHAPHDLDDPSGEDKRVFNVYYAPFHCGDGTCDPGEEESCEDDCA